ncbi:Calcium-dependent protein kinase, partial [Sesamum angolense]
LFISIFLLHIHGCEKEVKLQRFLWTFLFYLMRQFVKYSRFKQFALRALASTLDDEELADLRDQFDAIDVDKNGAMEKDLPWKMKDSRVVEILQAIDSNTDGLVDFSEFVAATLHVHQLEEHNSEKWQQRSQAAFEKFDVDRDGFITPEELKLHTCLRSSIDPLLEEADLDKDGRISLSEFRRLLRTASISSRGVHSPAAHRGMRGTRGTTGYDGVGAIKMEDAKVWNCRPFDVDLAVFEMLNTKSQSSFLSCH